MATGFGRPMLTLGVAVFLAHVAVLGADASEGSGADRAVETCGLTLPALSSFRLSSPSPTRLIIDIRGPFPESVQPPEQGACVISSRVDRSDGGDEITVELEILPGGLRSVEHSRGNLTLLLSATRTVPVEAAEPVDRDLRRAAETDSMTGGWQEDSYRIGIDDELKIAVAEPHNLERTVVVDRDGMISFDYIGSVKATGLTPAQLAATIKDLLDKDYLVSPDVSVRMERYSSQFVYVTGEVREPGKKELRGGTTLKEVLAEAKGYTLQAGDTVTVNREPVGGGESEKLRFSRREIDTELVNLTLRPGDVIAVPQQQYIYIQGQVNQPNRYAYEPGMTLIRSISLARGLREWANRKEVRLLRRVDGQLVGQTHNLRDIERLKSDDVELLPGDIIIVPKRLL